MSGVPTSGKRTHSELLHYAAEVKHLPLHRALQAAQKYVCSSDWSLARDELKFTRSLELLIESIKRPFQEPSVSTVPIKICNISHSNDPWSMLLAEVKLMAADFGDERRWKTEMARLIANEAAAFVRQGPTKYRYPRISDAPYKPKNFEPYTKHDDSVPIHEKDAFEWQPSEDTVAFEMRDADQSVTADVLNRIFHNGNKIRHSSTISSRIQMMIKMNDPAAKPSSCSDPTIDKIVAIKHLNRMSLMRGETTKLINLQSKPNFLSVKRLSLIPHASHEAAARKANMNIAKMVVTPMDLAMRRIQKTRTVEAPPANTAAYQPSQPELSPAADQTLKKATRVPNSNGLPAGKSSNFSLPTFVNDPETKSSSSISPQKIPSINKTPFVATNDYNQMQHPQNQRPFTTNKTRMANSTSTSPKKASRQLVMTPGKQTTSNNATNFFNHISPSTKALVQQQRLALWNRSQQIGAYLSSLNNQMRPPNPPPISAINSQPPMMIPDPNQQAQSKFFQNSSNFIASSKSPQKPISTPNVNSRPSSPHNPLHQNSIPYSFSKSSKKYIPKSSPEK